MLSAAPCRASPMRNPRTRKRPRQADLVGQGSDQVPRLRFDDNWTCDERALRFLSWSDERVVGSGGAGGSRIHVGAGSDETRGGPRSPRTSDGGVVAIVQAGQKRPPVGRSGPCRSGLPSRACATREFRRRGAEGAPGRCDAWRRCALSRPWLLRPVSAGLGFRTTPRLPEGLGSSIR